MANPIWNPVSNQYEYPMETIYADRQKDRDAAEYEAYFGTTQVDTSQQGLDEAAQGGEQMPKEGAGPVRPPIESASEAVRDKVQALADQPLLYKAGDTALKAITGGVVGLDDLTPEGIQRFNNRQHGMADFSKMADPLGNVAEATARENAKRNGATDEQADMVAGVVALASGILFPAPGKAGKLAMRAEGAAAKAGPQAMKGVNPSRLEGAAPDVERTIKNISFFNMGRLEQGAVSHGETIAKADELMTLQQALKFDVASKMDLATVQTAIAGHYRAASQYLADVSKRAATGDQAAAKEFWGAFAIATDLAEKDALVGTALGRGLESRKIALSEINVVGTDRMKEFAETIANSGMDPVIAAQRYLTLNSRQRLQMLEQSATAYRTGQNAIYEAWINSLLSGPQTHAANLASNTLTAAWAPGERFLASLASATEGAVGGDKSIYFGESAQMLYGMVEGAKDGLRVMGKALTQGAGGAGQKVERPPAITAQAFGLNPEGFVGAAVDYLGAVIRTPSRALVAEDEFFKAVNYRMELRALAYREAAQEGLSGSAFAARVKQIIAEPPPAVKARADQFALAQTFNQELDQLGSFERGLGRMGTSAQSIPMGRVVLPFVRTPANILNYAHERTPLINLFASTIVKDMQGTPEQRALALGKVAGGGMVSMVIAGYTASAINPEDPVPYMTLVTGEGPRDAKQRATLQRLGWQPYSVWTGSEYVSYKRLDPLGTILGIVATSTEMMGQLPERGVSEVSTAAAIAVSKAMLSKTFLEGLSTFLDTMEGKPEDFRKFFENLARSAAPAAARQTARTLDPVRREMDGLWDHWRAGLPGYDGPALVNLWGDEVMISGGLGPDLISPLYVSPHKPDDVDEWLQKNRIALPVGAPRVLGGTPPPNVQLEEPTRLKGIRLTNEEKHRLGILLGKGGDAGQLDGGPALEMGSLPPLKDAVREIIAGPGTGGPEGTKADLIRERVNLYRRAAVMQLRRESPMLDAALADLEQQRLDRKVNEPTPKAPAGMADVLKNLIPSLGR